MTKYNARVAVLLVALSAIIVSGCVGVGAKTVAKDRFDYNGAIADSWKSQMLLNVVRVRYGDAPIFLDVASVINSYEVSGATNVGASFNFSPYNSAANVGQTGFFANRPTGCVQSLGRGAIYPEHDDTAPALKHLFPCSGRLPGGWSLPGAGPVDKRD